MKKKALSYFICAGLVLVFGASCRDQPNKVSSRPEASEPSYSVWVGHSEDFWFLLRPNDLDLEVRRTRAATDTKTLGLAPESAIYQLYCCNFSRSSTVQLPVEISSDSAGLRSLPQQAPSEENARYLWNALGASRGPVELQAQKTVKLHLSGPREGLKASFQLALGELKLEMSQQAFSLEELQEFARSPKRKFFKQGA